MMPPHFARKPSPEPEIGLRELGCPYDALDPRTLVWIAGYRAGYNVWYEAARQISEEVRTK